MEIEVKCPIKNANGRTYSQNAFKKALENYKENSKQQGMFGGLEHPVSVNQLPINRLSDIAIKINDIKYDEKFSKEWLDANIEILKTPRGKIAEQLQVNGIPMKLEPNILSNPENGEIQILGFDFVIDKEAAVKKEILEFISKFQNEGTIKTFTEGCCYWFAKILCERFSMNHYVTIMMYNNIDGHFAAKINDVLYDITGEINETASWKMWDEFQENEPTYSKTIIKNCIKLLN